MTNAELRAKAQEILKPQFVTVLLSIVIVGILVGLINLIPIVGSLVALVIAGAINVGMALVCTTVTAGGTAKIEQVFEPIKTNLVNSMVACLLQGLFVCLWSLLLVIPGIMKAYSYAMTYYILRFEPELSGYDALKRSEQIMAGHRMELFKLQLSYIGWVLLGIITCGIAFIWVTPRMEIAKTLFFDNLYLNQNKAV